MDSQCKFAETRLKMKKRREEPLGLEKSSVGRRDAVFSMLELIERDAGIEGTEYRYRLRRSVLGFATAEDAYTFLAISKSEFSRLVKDGHITESLLKNPDGSQRVYPWAEIFDYAAQNLDVDPAKLDRYRRRPMS